MIQRQIRSLMRDERVRFLVVGGTNTVVGYGLFLLFNLVAGEVIGYIGSLYLSYVLAVVLAFVLHRRFTFRIVGSDNLVVDFARFASVYIVSLAINTVALPLLVELAGLTPSVAQAIVVVVTTLISYAGHKWFSFRRSEKSDVETEAPAITAA
jgi:putative flippase GtrA